MRYRPSRQRGITAISFLLLFILIGFVTLVALKLTPIYLEHFQIKATLNSLKGERDISSKTPQEIITMIEKRWDVNDIRRIKAQDSVFIEKNRGVTKIQVAYEAEEHIIGNVSVLVKFDDSIEVGDSN